MYKLMKFQNKGKRGVEKGKGGKSQRFTIFIADVEEDKLYIVLES